VSATILSASSSRREIATSHKENRPTQQRDPQLIDQGFDDEPASESLRRTNAQESGERLAVYGDLAWQQPWRGMVFPRSLRAGTR
jgi:hypothetical protein